MRALASVFLLGLALLGWGEVSAIYGKTSPAGAAAETRPTIAWQVTPTGGGRVSRVEMRINDVLVPAEFDDETNTAEYRPTAPMAAGLYDVECRVTIDREVTVRKSWVFEIGDGPSTASARGLDEINLVRTELGQPALSLDDRLCAAAAAHTRYQILNQETCHIEDPAKPGFSGKAPWDRIQRFGFPGVCYEGACGNQMDVRKAVRLLFDAPYHRIAFLQPGTAAIGIGFESGALTIDYAISNREGDGMSPAPGQVDVPLAWDGIESPSPLDIHGAHGPVGYPIVFGRYSKNLDDAAIDSMVLFAPDGSVVPAYLNTPRNDPELRFAAILTPKQRLQPRTTYRVCVSGRSNSGDFIRRDWTFTTGS